MPEIGHSHGHMEALDPNAAWFAAIGVLSKEWLYRWVLFPGWGFSQWGAVADSLNRITKKVADEEHSPVLLANAVHHRSDAYSSVVALVAILGTWIFPHIPLDPIGGKFSSFIRVFALSLSHAYLLSAFIIIPSPFLTIFQVLLWPWSSCGKVSVSSPALTATSQKPPSPHPPRKHS